MHAQKRKEHNRNRAIETLRYTLVVNVPRVTLLTRPFFKRGSSTSTKMGPFTARACGVLLLLTLVVGSKQTLDCPLRQSELRRGERAQTQPPPRTRTWMQRVDALPCLPIHPAQLSHTIVSLSVVAPENKSQPPRRRSPLNVDEPMPTPGATGVRRPPRVSSLPPTRPPPPPPTRPPHHPHPSRPRLRAVPPAVPARGRLF